MHQKSHEDDVDNDSALLLRPSTDCDDADITMQSRRSTAKMIAMALAFLSTIYVCFQFGPQSPAQRAASTVVAGARTPKMNPNSKDVESVPQEAVQTPPKSTTAVSTMAASSASSGRVTSGAQAVLLQEDDYLPELLKPPTNKYHVFQISGTRVASTLTVNLLIGLFEDRKAYRSYMRSSFTHEWRDHGRRTKNPPLNSSIVTKTHNTNVEQITKHFEGMFEKVFFVGNNRREMKKMLPREFCASDTYPNVVCLEYEDLLYDDIAGLRRVVKHVRETVQEAFAYFSKVTFDEEEAVQRILDFDKVKKNCRKKDKKYGIGKRGTCNRTMREPSK